MNKNMEKKILLCFLLFLAGCSTISREVHFFKDKAGTPPNYYRLTLVGKTFMTSSRYVTGFYDEQAVALYFNEIAQPEGGTLIQTKEDNDKSGVQSLKETLRGKSLVIILSTNSDAIANAIGTFADNQQMLTALAGLINRDRIVEARETSTEIKTQGIKDQALVNLGTSVIEGLSDDASESQTKAAFLSYVSALSVGLGNKKTFTNLDEANKWFNENRDNF